MKVVANKLGSLSISPQTIVHFVKGEELTVGHKGLSEENLNRLVELNLCDEAAEEEGELIVETTGESEVKIPDAYDFESITDKNELIEYAKEIYTIDLDGSKSIKKMIADLKKAVEGDK